MDYAAPMEFRVAAGKRSGQCCGPKYGKQDVYHNAAKIEQLSLVLRNVCSTSLPRVEEAERYS